MLDNEELLLRAVTCPHHILVFKTSPKSYKDLTYKMAEEAKLLRYESCGSLIGLERVRAKELFDSHVFCTRENIETNIIELNEMILRTMSHFNIEIGRDGLSLRSVEKTKDFDVGVICETSQTMLRIILKKFNYRTKLSNEEIERRVIVNKHTNLKFF